MVFLKGTKQNLTDLFDGFGSLNTWNLVHTSLIAVKTLHEKLNASIYKTFET